jgi:L-threonylcarbamoyladenylate synthase
MFSSLELLFDALGQLPPRTRTAIGRLLPGPVTLVVANPGRRFPLACGSSPERLGVRVPELLGPLAPIGSLQLPVLQSSANRSGGPDARRLADVDPEIRSGADVELDGGELPGTASTVVDLSRYEEAGRFEVLREGAVPADLVHDLL